jgi:two-component system sensor histidine kinase CpxA
MRSLFLKIFLWFGLAMVVINVASFMTGILTERRSQPPRHSPMAQSFGVLAQTAAEIFEKDGQTALASYLDRVEGASHIHAVLFDENGNEVSGRAVPNGTKELSQRTNQQSGFLFVFPDQNQRPLGALAIRGTGGASYVMVGELPKPDFPWIPRLGERGSLLFGLRMVGRTLLPLLLVGALFCYWLARYLSAPVVQLRNATRQLSNGNLTARVNENLLKRRDEITYLGQDFNLMAARIESLVEAQRRLLADISHELRSPLARQGVAVGLARRRGGPEVSSALDRIGRESDRMNVMIGQLLALSRSESGADVLAKVKVDLGALLQEITDDADFEARDRDRSVRVIRFEPSVTVGELELIRSAIENVVRNAVRYTSPGTQVEVSLTSEPVNGHRYAVVRVRDHGKGVPNAAIDEIFRPFYRVEDARDRKSGGTGLGLAIAARAVRLHDGTISAENAPDGGLVVEIRLPVREHAQTKPNRNGHEAPVNETGSV